MLSASPGRADGVPMDSVPCKGLQGHQLPGPVASHGTVQVVMGTPELRGGHGKPSSGAPLQGKQDASSFSDTIPFFGSIQEFSIIPWCLTNKLFTSKLYIQQNVIPAICNGLLNPTSPYELEGTGEKVFLLQSLAALLGLVFREGSMAGWEIGQVS